MDARDIDELVLGTVNAPYKASIDAEGLAAALRDPDPEKYHLNTFFSDVSARLIVRFALNHGISFDQISAAYATFLAKGGISYPNFERNMEARKRLHDRATEVFGEEEKAERWLSRPLSVLGGRPPDKVAEDNPETVFNILEKIAWGVPP